MTLRQLPVFLVKLCSSISCFAWMSITGQIAVFRNLRTSTKLFLLCGVFLVSIFVASYGLVAEKLIAIEFARKELVGTRYLEAVREVYAWILADGLSSPSRLQTRSSARRRQPNHGKRVY